MRSGESRVTVFMVVFERFCSVVYVTSCRRVVDVRLLERVVDLVCRRVVDDVVVLERVVDDGLVLVDLGVVLMESPPMLDLIQSI
jgi:hypothetical protein